MYRVRSRQIAIEEPRTGPPGVAISSRRCGMGKGMESFSISSVFFFFFTRAALKLLAAANRWIPPRKAARDKQTDRWMCSQGRTIKCGFATRFFLPWRSSDGAVLDRACPALLSAPSRVD